MRRLLFPTLALAFLTTACVQNIDATRVGVPVTLASTAGSPVPPGGEPFVVEESLPPGTMLSVSAAGAVPVSPQV